MSQKLYTAAEARRIDKALRAASKEADRGGRITRGKPFERAIEFNEETLVWGFQWANDFVPVDISGEDLLIKQWLPLTASLEASTPEPEPEQVLYSTPDYGVIIDKNLSMLSIRHQNRTCTRHIENWVALSSGEGERIEQLEKELAEREKTINIQKQTISNREQELDKLKWKQRWKSCGDELPRDGLEIVYKDLFLAKGFYSATGATWHLRTTSGAVKLENERIKNWNWKYEADL